jgi:MATE family multidrug resistance protein
MPAARRPIVELLRLALPTVAQMASYTVMQFIDTWILSRLGETAATAAGNSGMLCFAFIGLGVGTLVIVNTLASQSFGRGDFAECGQYMWQGIWLGLLYGLALLPLRALGGPLFRAFGHPADMAAMEAAYWKIVILSAAMKLVSTTVGQFLLSVDRPNYVLISAVAGVSINAIAAWAMVLGHLGLRSMGIAGAAWAQNIGVCCEMLTLLVLALRIPRKFGALYAAIRPAQMATLIRVGLPSGLQLFSDVLAWSVFCNSVVGLLGSAAMAANTFMLRYLVVSFMPVIGLQTAVTALVGRYIGRRQPEVAQRRAHLAFSVALVYIVIC